MNLWKYLFILTKNKEEGFTIPLILGFGLFMVLIAITTIKTSSNSETNSKLQKSSAQALAAAETGLSRLQVLLDANRDFAVYPDCVTRDSDGTCTDTGDVASWHNDQIIIDNTTKSFCGSLVNYEDTDLIEALVTQREWQPISDNPDDGEYRLLSYTYANVDGLNEPPGIGSLIVQGRTSGDVNQGTAQIRADIPVNERIIVLTDMVPGLWMKYNNSTQMANDKINGDIVVEGCNLPGGVSTNNLLDTATQKLAFNPDPMPDTAPLPAGVNLIGDGIPSANGLADPAITNPFAIGNFPRGGDEVAPDGYYHYLIKNLDYSGGSDITITAGAKVIFYVQGNISLGGSLTINAQDNGNTPTNLQIYGNTTLDTPGSGLNGTDYKYGCSSGVTCPTSQVVFNGTGEIKALIHAPDATAGVAGGGDAEGQIKGTLWVGNWVKLSNNGKVKVDAVGYMTDLVSATSVEKIEPQITVTSNWAREAVEDVQ